MATLMPIFLLFLKLLRRPAPNLIQFLSSTLDFAVLSALSQVQLFFFLTLELFGSEMSNLINRFDMHLKVGLSPLKFFLILFPVLFPASPILLYFHTLFPFF